MNVPTRGRCCSIVELRQYKLRPGKRDHLIELFEREFLESQEALEMTVVGQFRDLDDPDQFVWLRGFPDMATRAVSLAAFYYGPVWARHREEANATIVDSDNVLLLKPARPDSAFVIEERSAAGEGAGSDLVVANIYYPKNGNVDQLSNFVARSLEPALADLDAKLLAVFVTEETPNNFPRLPVRESERVLVTFTAYPYVQSNDQRAGSTRTPTWPHLEDEVMRHVDRVDVLRLRATSRSRCRGVGTRA